MLCRTALLLIALLSASPATAAAAQAPTTPQPQTDSPTIGALVANVLAGFAAGSGDEFAALNPDPDARRLVGFAIEAGWPRRSVGGGVVRAAGDSAVVWLAGYAEAGHSGYETSLGQMFTGLYAAVRDATGWRLTQKLELDRGNRIIAQAITADLRPGEGLVVRDTISATMGPHPAFWATLNRVAELDEVLVNGQPAPFDFKAGLLRVAAPAGRPVELVLAYRLDVGRDSARNGYFARFEPDFGHVRNQHYWHPSFGFRNPNGAARFALTVRAPADLHVVTDLPQRERLNGDVRTVTARSSRPTAALTLMYDRAWRPSSHRIGRLQVHLAVDDSVRPSRAAIRTALGHTHRVLRERFGEPQSRYLVVAQGRGQQGHGWIFRSNDLLAGGPVGGELVRTGARPRALFGHEAAHGWTAPVGPGSNWLSEGWAMYAEGLLLADEFGADAAVNFWESLRADYEASGYEGEASLADDRFNAGVSYPKGAWVLRMLEDHVGTGAFDRGMRRWMNLPADVPATVDAFTAEMTAASGRDVAAFLAPWLTETVLPDVTVETGAGGVTLTQQGPVFVLDADLAIVHDGGVARRRVEIRDRVTVVPLDGLRGVRGAVLDPEHRLLLRRRRSDVVSIELTAPDAKQVELGGNFSRSRVPATRDEHGVWRAVLTLTEGRYSHYWVVDGKRRDAPGGELLIVSAAPGS